MKLTEFLECDTCRAKPGSPVLCSGCVHNRNAIFMLLETPEKSRSELLSMLRKWLESDIVKATRYYNNIEKEERGGFARGWRFGLSEIITKLENLGI